jgi:hypothetical protein
MGTSVYCLGKHLLWYDFGHRRQTANCSSETSLFSPYLQTSHLWIGHANFAPLIILVAYSVALDSFSGKSNCATHLA